MESALQRTGSSFRDMYEAFLPMVYRLAYTYLKNPQDSEDAAQETFLRLMHLTKPLQSREHCKAWLIVTVGNVCKDMLRRKRHTELPLEDCYDLQAEPAPDHELLREIMELPDKYKTAVYLYYYEGYSVKEMAELLGQERETVKTWLRRARAQLKQRLGEDFDA